MGVAPLKSSSSFQAQKGVPQYYGYKTYMTRTTTAKWCVCQFESRALSHLHGTKEAFCKPCYSTTGDKLKKRSAQSILCSRFLQFVTFALIVKKYLCEYVRDYEYLLRCLLATLLVLAIGCHFCYYIRSLLSLKRIANFSFERSTVGTQRMFRVSAYTNFCGTAWCAPCVFVKRNVKLRQCFSPFFSRNYDMLKIRRTRFLCQTGRKFFLLRVIFVT